jgi:hypothetical protein
VLLGLTAEVPDIGDRVGLIPALAPRNSAKPLDDGIVSAPQHDGVVHDLHRQPVARQHAEATPRLAWNDNLVLGTHLDA